MGLPRLVRHAVPILTICAGLCLAGTGAALLRAQAAAPAPAPSGEPGTAAELVERLGNAWFARDFHEYMALWDFSSGAEREAEVAAAREAFAADETRLTVLAGPRPVRGSGRLAVDVRVFSTTEPHARVDYWRLLVERRGLRWAFVEKQAGSEMDGLVHLPLHPEAWRVRGVVLSLEDLELRMEDGSLFSTPESVGRTAFVFVGRGRVRFTPGPHAEAEQLRQFAGAPHLDHAVKWAFFRIHPDDFERLFDTRRLEKDPRSSERLKEALRRWSEWSTRTFLVDADLPRSPWWLYPNVGDSVVEFPWKRNRVLTYARAGSESEDVNLFERDRGLRICSYPSRGRPDRPAGSQQGAVDTLHHNLIVRFDPARRALSAVDTVRLRLLSPTATLRFRLHDDFEMSSVSTESGESLLFLRVRGQGSLVVSLGRHSGRADEFTLTFRYSGRHEPAPMSQELVQLFPEPQPAYVDRAFVTPPPLVYSNRTAWYPQPAEQDFATLRAHFDTPDDVLAVTGGELLGARTEEGRTRATYELREPGKYFTAIVGRLEDVGMRQLGGRTVRGFAAPRTYDETRDNMVTVEELVAFFGERYGPCPYPALNQVTAEASAPAGHGPPGLVYVQRRPAMLIGQPLRPDPANFSDLPDFFLAHEVAHQWWGQGVAPATYREQWLSEAWAQYSAALWIRHREGEDAFRGMMERMADWARRYDDEGPIDLGQRLGHLEQDPRIQRALVYNKGAWVLHMLRQRLGDEAFFGGARAFLEAHRYGGATTADLRAALEAASGRDLGPYFEGWIYGTGLPEIRFATRTEETPDGYRTTVRVEPKNLPGPLPLEIRVGTKGSPEVRRVELEPAGGTWTITSAEPVRDVQLNEDLTILAEPEQVSRLPESAQR